MESLSRSFHTRKLSNASTLSGKNPYDGVFSGHRRKYDGAPAANVEDYREIFSSSQAASSIPVLDLSTFEDSSDGSSSRLRSSKPDYTKIFGGFRDEDIAVSYEELFARDKAGAPSSTRPTSQDSDNFSHQSFDALKQFNMSYHKISQRGKDDIDRTTHVTQLHAVPGFTCFINETDPPQKKEDDKQKASVINNGDSSVDSNSGGFPEKQTSESVVKSRSKYQRDESFSDDNYFKTSHPSIVSSPSPIKHKDYPKRPIAKSDNSESVPEEFSPGYLDEELDVNSAAAISAAALKKAIDKAQESIRIAKESVGRKKEGLRSFSNKSFKDSLKVKGRMENVAAGEEQKRKDDNVKGGFEKVGATKNHEYGGTSVSPDFKDGEKLSVAKKVLEEIQGKVSESAKKHDIPIESSHELRDSKIIRNSTEVLGETEATNPDSGKNSIMTTEFEQANLRKNMMSEDDNGGKFKVFETSNGTVEQPVKELEISREDLQEGGSSVQGSTGFILQGTDKKLGESEDSIEDKEARDSKESKDEVRLSGAHKLLKDSNNLTQGSNQNDHKKILNEALGLLENEKQEEGLEQEHIEKVENAEINEKNSYDKACDKGFEEASEWLENEEELKEDIRTESQKEEDLGERFYDVCEVKINESAQNYTHSVEKSEVSLKEDHEMKHKDRQHKGEVLELEIDGNSSSGDTKESCKFDNIVEASEEVDDVSVESVQLTEDSSEFNGEERESTEAVYTSEEQEIFEKTSVDQSASEDNEDECELKTENLPNFGSADVDLGTYETEENAPSESYSYTVLGMEIEANKSKEKDVLVEEEKSDLGAPHEERPKNRITEENGAYQEPKVLTMDVNENTKRRQYGENKDEISEREREKNKIAVERAIREARERAFLEARERAERAAVERATAEVRERVMAEAREKVAKASVSSKLSSERTSAQSKIRAERAAVERATSEARQRALEKAMSQKTTSEIKQEANGIRQSSSSSDLHSSNGTSAESAQRSKAKLEKHSRIMERAAKALAEKEKRDLLAQKEQAERNRLAESLDADIKRWSSGKEGNLRALLSTLQYILGAESGWQSVSLTEIITTSAVKKAYRKATLCVHPDKLQQRGATIQQKYICEKVFDLLKAAWNRFNSEER